MSDAFHDPTECGNHELGFPPQFSARLTRLFVAIDWTITHLMTILEQCINLEEVTVDFQAHPTIYPENPIPQAVERDGLLLPRVRKLCLEHADAGSLLILLFLRLPVIRRLEMILVGMTTPSPSNPSNSGTSTTTRSPLPVGTPICSPSASTTQKLDFMSMCLSVQCLPLFSLSRTSYWRVIVDAMALFSEGTSRDDNGEQLFAELETLELLKVESDFDIDRVFNFLWAPARFWNSAPQPITTQPMHPCIRKLKITFRDLASDMRSECNYDYSRATTSPLVEKGVDVQVGPEYYIVS